MDKEEATCPMCRTPYRKFFPEHRYPDDPFNEELGDPNRVIEIFPEDDLIFDDNSDYESEDETMEEVLEYADGVLEEADEQTVVVSETVLEAPVVINNNIRDVIDITEDDDDVIILDEIDNRPYLSYMRALYGEDFN